PMRQELTDAGFEGLRTPAEVDNALNQEGTDFEVVNSVCGCAAANARPAAKAATQSDKNPAPIVTDFAGVEHDAVDKARSHMAPYPPSSPSMALFKDGKLVHMIARHHIEGKPAQMIADNLIAAFDEYC